VIRPALQTLLIPRQDWLQPGVFVSSQAIATAIACVMSAIVHLVLNEADGEQRELRLADVQRLYSLNSLIPSLFVRSAYRSLASFPTVTSSSSISPECGTSRPPALRGG
jgi:hypothetical protein